MALVPEGNQQAWITAGDIGLMEKVETVIKFLINKNLQAIN